MNVKITDRSGIITKNETCASISGMVAVEGIETDLTLKKNVKFYAGSQPRLELVIHK